METQIGNVSRTADAEFLRLLKNEDPKRYEHLMRNMRREQPASRLPEDQALTNFMLGRSTGQWRFEIIAGDPAPVPVEVDSGAAERRRNTQMRIKQARTARARLRAVSGRFENSDSAGAQPGSLAA
jgi:hypothetical protein